MKLVNHYHFFQKLSKAVGGRPLPYPYTFGAQIMQFPYKFHWNNSWWVK